MLLREEPPTMIRWLAFLAVLPAAAQTSLKVNMFPGENALKKGRAP
jgi:hypothetical protein